MLIKDPYLGSEIKHRSFSTIQPQNVGESTQKQNIPKNPYLTQPHQKPQVKDPKNNIQSYERQIRSLSQAYRNQEQALRKISGLHFVNKEYNEAMKIRNYELNAKLNDLTYEKSLLAKRHEEQVLKSSYDKDLILKKYQQQNDQIIRLKRANSELLQQKARLQSEIDHLMFLMEKDSHQGSLEIKQQIIRMENMQRTLRSLIDTKDAEIVQLRHRIKVYEDENKRLNDMNRTLTITRQQLTKQHQKIENLSNISQIDSNIKSANKQNVDMNRRDDFLISQLNQQKQVNKQLISEINMMKKKLFENNEKSPEKGQIKEQRKFANHGESLQTKIDRHNQMREKINMKMYQIYCKSVKQGERQKRNSLILFIQNYKKSHAKQLLPQINQYMSLREELKQTYKTETNYENKKRIQLQLPMKLNSRQHSKDSQWVLSTMQLTKNQKAESQSKGETDETNNMILFLFRLLTIEFRTKHPLENKKYDLDADVQNELLHSIVKATQSLIQIN